MPLLDHGRKDSWHGRPQIDARDRGGGEKGEGEDQLVGGMEI